MNANTRPLSAKAATLLIVGGLLVAMVFQVLAFFTGMLKTAPQPIDCKRLVEDAFIEGKLDLLPAIPINRFAPHQYGETQLDDGPLHSTPQVFRTLAVTIQNNERVLTQHCEAIYTDVSAAHGAAVEMPAHCLRSIEHSDAFANQYNNSQLSSNNEAITSTGALIHPLLNNVCVYMGANVREPEQIFRVLSAQCKSRLDQAFHGSLLNDSCIVKLDKPISQSISGQPLRWWRPSSDNDKPDWAQLTVDLGIEDGEFSCNIDSGNIESSRDLAMVSHSIDNDGLGLLRVTSKGKAIYQHSNEGVIMHSGLLPNDIDTRSGDSGAAVLAQIEGKKTLVGMQVAVMSGYTQRLPQAQQKQNANYLKNYNVAIHPHIGPASKAGYPYIYRAK